MSSIKTSTNNNDNSENDDNNSNSDDDGTNIKINNNDHAYVAYNSNINNWTSRKLVNLSLYMTYSV